MIGYIIYVLVQSLAIFAACYFGTRLGFRHGRRITTIHTVETIKDTEGNLDYTIELGCRGPRRTRKWFWNLEVERKGESQLTGDMTFGGVRIPDIEGMGDPADLQIGAEARGGPHDTKEEALAEALRAMEHMR